MDTWVIFGAAFGGGLAGAVLQPIVGHVLELARSDVVHRKGIEQRLRRMVTTELAFGRGLIAKATVILLEESLGRPRGQTRRLTELRDLMPEGHVWQPTRIRDRELREAAQEHAKRSGELWVECGAVNMDAARMTAPNKELEQLQPEITSRMDELNWPEVED